MRAQPNPVITFEELLCLFMFNFLPVVTEIARVAASLKRPNILPDEVNDMADEGSEESSPPASD